MKIIHVISAMTVEAGGPPMVCQGLAMAQAALGHDVTIGTVDFPGQVRITAPANIQTVAFPLHGTPRYAKSPGLKDWLETAIPQADFVHLHSIWQYPTFATAQVCWKYQKPYVVLLNGMLDVYSIKQRNFWVKWLYWLWREKKILSRARALHCLNEAEIRRAVGWIANLPKFVCGNGVSSAELATLPERGRFRAAHPEIGDRPLVLFLSRLHPKKGLDRLVPVWGKFVKRHPEAVFVVAGAGAPDYVAQLDRLIGASGMTGKIIRVGQLAGADKWAALVDADVFAL
ncbi:MAG: glycosyltransferase, partial [Phycisphaerae bacterium]